VNVRGFYIALVSRIKITDLQQARLCFVSCWLYERLSNTIDYDIVTRSLRYYCKQTQTVFATYKSSRMKKVGNSREM
jgi:hypothetical protein